jgi:methylmalonyl-CoA mutase C-terminal domain/subunit
VSPAAKALLAKVGLDGHDRALHMLALELRDRGVEVIILGVGTTPEHIAATALQEDVDVVGVSILSGAHLALMRRVVEQLRAQELPTPVLCGGTIPGRDVAALLDAGVAAVAPVGTSVTEAADLLVEAGRHRSDA